MVLQYALVLPLHDRADVRRQLFLQRFLIARFRDVLAALAFLEHRLVVTAGDRRLDVHPATVRRARERAFALRFPAEALHLRLQLARRFSAAHRRLLEHRLQVRAANVFRTDPETFLAVLAGL